MTSIGKPPSPGRLFFCRLLWRPVNAASRAWRPIWSSSLRASLAESSRRMGYI